MKGLIWKKQCSASCCLPNPCFAFWSLIVVFANVIIQIPEKRTANIHRMTFGSPMLAIERAPAIMTPKPIAWVQRFVILRLDIFIMGGILWLYQTQDLFIICAPDTDVTENNHSVYSWTASHKKKAGAKYTLPWFLTCSSPLAWYFVLLPKKKTLINF